MDRRRNFIALAVLKESDPSTQREYVMHQRRRICRITFCLLVVMFACVGMPPLGKAQGIGETARAPAKLQSHRMAAGLSANIVERFSGIVPRGRMMYLPQSGQLVVYAKPELQQRIADRIRSDRSVEITSGLPGPRETDGEQVAADKEQVAAHEGGTPEKDELHQSGIRSLPLPRRPVQIVHLKELDLLIITTSH